MRDLALTDRYGVTVMGDDQGLSPLVLPGQYVVEDDWCGQFTAASEGDRDWPGRVARHFAVVHGRFGELCEGVDFRLVPALVHCDLCGIVAESPWWEHRTDAQIENLGFAFDDGVWQACDRCHTLVIARDIDGLVRRIWEGAKHTSPGLAEIIGPQLRAQARVMMMQLVPHMDAGRREEW